MYLNGTNVFTNCYSLKLLKLIDFLIIRFSKYLFSEFLNDTHAFWHYDLTNVYSKINTNSIQYFLI